LRIIFSLGFWALIIEALFIDNLPYELLLVVNFFIGVGLNGTYPIMLEALMEKFYPIHELVLISAVVSIACVRMLIISIDNWIDDEFPPSIEFIHRLWLMDRVFLTSPTLWASFNKI